ncbi:MAG: hypothetical protein ACMVO3_25160 [Thalassobaculum sp.]
MTLDVFQEVRAVRRSLGIEQGAVRILIDAREADLSELTADDFKALEPPFEKAILRERPSGRPALSGASWTWASLNSGLFYRNRSVPAPRRFFSA